MTEEQSTKEGIPTYDLRIQTNKLLSISEVRLGLNYMYVHIGTYLLQI